MKHKLSFIWLLLEIHFCFSQSVGVGTANIDPSAKLQIESSNQGFLPPRLTTIQRNLISNPATGLTIYNTTTNCLEYYNGTQWVSTCQPQSLVCYQNCNQIKQWNPCSLNGVYTIDIDCGGPMQPIQCYCDMTTDGGGWTLVLNYLHQGGTNPNLNVRTFDLPLLNSTVLGGNESGTIYWGHASNSLMNLFCFAEVRFYGITNAHSRVMHFKTPSSNVINYFKTGVGDCTGIGASFTALSGHTAFLPAATTAYFGGTGNLAMVEHPFFVPATYHWGIKGWRPSCSCYDRWEVDNNTYPSNHSAYDTYHQVWIR